jgi:hypothetical protein
MALNVDLTKLAELIPFVKALTSLPERVSQLEKRFAALETVKSAERKFTDYDGAKFKRNPDGSWQNVVFCPKCETSTEKFPDVAGEMIFVCARCGWGSGFTVEDLPAILKKLEQLE